MSGTVRWNSAPAERMIRKAAMDALEDAGEFLLEEANRTVPIEEGTLARSGQVTRDDRKGEVWVTYDTPYAVRQHEDTRLRHDPGRRAKWLERTFKEQGGRVGKFLADRTKRRLR